MNSFRAFLSSGGRNNLAAHPQDEAIAHLDAIAGWLDGSKNQHDIQDIQGKNGREQQAAKTTATTAAAAAAAPPPLSLTPLLTTSVHEKRHRNKLSQQLDDLRRWVSMLLVNVSEVRVKDLRLEDLQR